MIDIKVTINGTEYKKNVPKLKDYIRLIDYNEKYYGKSFINTKEAVIDAVALIESWFDGEVTAQDIEDNYDLAEIMSLFRTIESNVFEVFTGVPLKTAMDGNQTARKKKKGKA